MPHTFQAPGFTGVHVFIYLLLLTKICLDELEMSNQIFLNFFLLRISAGMFLTLRAVAGVVLPPWLSLFRTKEWLSSLAWFKSK